MIVTENSRWDGAQGVSSVPEVLSGLYTSRSPQLSVIIPVFNEADNCDPLLTEISASLAGKLDYEIIVVDDASKDATYSRLRELHRYFPRLRVLRHLQNSGQSAALLSGVRAASAPWVVTLDGDGQNDPNDIARLLAARDTSESGSVQMVAGWRRRREDSWLKRFSSRLANRVRGRLLGDECPDTGCGLKLFARDAFLALPHFDHMHRFLPALIRRNGGSVVIVEVNHRPRLHGYSKYGVVNRLWVGIIDMFGVLWLQHRRCYPRAEEEF